jgi:hypothetical protein
MIDLSHMQPNKLAAVASMPQPVEPKAAAKAVTATINKPPSNPGPYKQRAILICGFPGVGKTWLSGKAYRERFPGLPIEDLESITFTYEDDAHKIKRPDFPSNYVSHIKERCKLPGIVMVTSHEKTRKLMLEQGLKFVSVYPLIELKEEYLARYKNRNSPQEIIDVVDRLWVEFITGFQAERGYKHKQLAAGQFLEDIIDEIVEEDAQERYDEV